MARTLRERKRCHPFSLSYVGSRAGEGMRRAEAPSPVLFLSSFPVFKRKEINDVDEEIMMDEQSEKACEGCTLYPSSPKPLSNTQLLVVAGKGVEKRKE